jgi:hypothetical protein
LILGDFNVHWGENENTEFRKLREILENFNLKQFVNFQTHLGGSTLDLIITRGDDNLILNVNPGDTLADHTAVSVTLNLSKPKPLCKTLTFRKIKQIDSASFCEDLNLESINECNTSTEMVTMYNKLLTTNLDRYAPEISKVIPIRPKVPWYNARIKSAIAERRQCERRWRKTKLIVHQQMFLTARNKCIYVIREEKQKYYVEKIEESGRDQKQLFRFINSLLHRKKDTPLPTLIPKPQLPNIFSDYFYRRSNVLDPLSSLKIITLLLVTKIRVITYLTPLHPQQMQRY